jgi:hypothetical protein
MAFWRALRRGDDDDGGRAGAILLMVLAPLAGLIQMAIPARGSSGRRLGCGCRTRASPGGRPRISMAAGAGADGRGPAQAARIVNPSPGAAEFANLFSSHPPTAEQSVAPRRGNERTGIAAAATVR